MALPPEVPADKVQRVDEALSRMSAREKGALPPLDNDDFRLFGAISQHFCFLDLSLRRALELMHMVKMLPPEHVKKYPNYSDADLSEILSGSVDKMGLSTEEHEEAKFRLGEIGHCRTYRNLINHFAGKRFQNEDVYVFASKSNRDARKVLRKSLPDHGVHFSVAGRSELFELENLLNGHQAWLSNKIPEWDEKYVRAENKTGDAAKSS